MSKHLAGSFFEIPKGDEKVAKCNKCSALITCVDKRGKRSTTALNTHVQNKHGNQIDVGAALSIRDMKFAQFGEAAFQKTRLIPIPEDMAIDVDADAPTDGPKPAFAPGQTDSGEEFEVNDSAHEEGDAMLECLTDYCF